MSENCPSACKKLVPGEPCVSPNVYGAGVPQLAQVFITAADGTGFFSEAIHTC
jgi:hypothetical protein